MRPLLTLAWPVVLGYVGLMTMGLVDLLFVGRVSAVALGAVGIATAGFAWAMVFGLGLLSSLDYYVAFSFGRGDRQACRVYASQGLWISFAVSLPLMAVLHFLSWRFGAFGVHEEVARLAGEILRILVWSLPPTLAFAVLRQYLQAMNEVRAAMWVLLVANLVNAGIGWVLVFGHLGLPALGAVGTGWATLVSRWFTFCALALFVRRFERREATRSWPFALDRSAAFDLLKMGWPAGSYMLFEVGVFALSTVLAGRLDPASLAAHQIVLSLASQTFMVPLGIGAASAVLVGQSLGRGERALARSWGWRALGLGAGFAVFSSAAFLLLPEPLLRFYTEDGTVIAAGRAILLVAALFQFSDCAQVIAAGALRGWGETRGAAIANLLGHWGLGLPIGTWLCFTAGRGLHGLWIGLSIGLTAVAISLVWRWNHVSRRLS